MLKSGSALSIDCQARRTKKFGMRLREAQSFKKRAGSSLTSTLLSRRDQPQSVNMTTHIKHIELAKTLPPRLLRFFARFPPQQLVAPPTQAVDSSSPDSNAPSHETSNQPSSSPPSYENPFRNTKHTVTGNWHDPIFSLRRQADLVKMARAHGVEELLPFTTKGTEERIRKREEFGLRVKGTGVGQRVKGKWWERNIRVRLEKRRQAMLDMPQMVQTWKQVNAVPAPFTLALTRYLAWPWSGVEEVPQIGCYSDVYVT